LKESSGVIALLKRPIGVMAVIARPRDKTAIVCAEWGIAVNRNSRYSAQPF
jgi:hypothetical protein